MFYFICVLVPQPGICDHAVTLKSFATVVCCFLEAYSKKKQRARAFSSAGTQASSVCPSPGGFFFWSVGTSILFFLISTESKK